MIKVFLHGSMKDRFGDHFYFDVPDLKMLASALCRQIKGFKEKLRTGEFIILRGDLKNGQPLPIEQAQFRFGGCSECHIIPVPYGSGGGRGGGAIKTIIGATLLVIATAGAALAAVGPAAGLAWGAGIGAGFFAGSAGVGAAFGFTYGTLAMVGLGLLGAGVTSLLTPRPNLDSGFYEGREDPDKRPSFLFNGPSNQSTQGLPVPLVYGRIRTGSVIVSAGLTTEKL